jgi:acetyltransferase-like isoleucine patch superfamily enzyme
MKVMSKKNRFWGLNKKSRNNLEKKLKIELKFLKLGKRVIVVEPTNIYGSQVGDDVFIGPFCEIQSETIIGDRTRIQSHTFVCSLVIIGNDCFVGHGVMFINDVFSSGVPSRGNKNLWKSTKIGNNVYIGSNATILPVEITANVVIGAGSVVTKSITKPGIYAGNPAKKIRDLR